MEEHPPHERRTSAGSFGSFNIGNTNNNNNNDGLDASINSSFDGGAGEHTTVDDILNRSNNSSAVAVGGGGDAFQDHNGGYEQQQQQQYFEQQQQQRAEQEMQQITQQQQQQQQQVYHGNGFSNAQQHHQQSQPGYQPPPAMASEQVPAMSSTSGDGSSNELSNNNVSNDAARIESNLHAVEQAIGYQQQPQPQQQQQHQKPPPQSNDVIELLDSDDEEDNGIKLAPTSVSTNGVKRSHSQAMAPSAAHAAAAPKRTSYPIQVGSTIAGYDGSLAQYRPDHQYQQQHHMMRMQQARQQQQQQQQQQQYQHHRQYTQYQQHHGAPYHQPTPPPAGQAAAVAQHYQQQQRQHHRPTVISVPTYFSFPQGHKPSWHNPLPKVNIPRHGTSNTNEPKSFELSLLNVKEFTITGISTGMFDTRRTSVLGYRKAIKDICKPHGKAVFERDKENEDTESGTDGGKWRLPLGAYRQIVHFLDTLPYCSVRGIPEEQLKIASLGKARLEKGFPSVEKIVSLGVPRGLASAMAPFQRGGVEFVSEKHGRALIADDMGLGKTIQAVASMSIYHDEWPILVLTPSSARYHWEGEFQQWLGEDSTVNRRKKENESKAAVLMSSEEDNEENEVIPPEDYKKPMGLLYKYEIHVLTSSKEEVFPHSDVKVVICSYGLAPALIEAGKIRPGSFKCAIVDESHMLKNMKTKRARTLVPVLHATSRCVLLSGTPALARPSELWPQLKILSTERDGWWEDEGDFITKYVQRTSAVRRAELHAMLTGTLMIRRLKHNILKSLPSKKREKALVDAATSSMRHEFHNCMKLLRQGKGVMAKLAQKRSALPPPEVPVDGAAIENLRREQERQYQEGMSHVHHALQAHGSNVADKENYVRQHEASIRQRLDVWFNEQVHGLKNGLHNPQNEEIDRKTVLNRMYSLTAKAKVPLIADNIKKWLDDPTKGKLCVFAHHIFVLDELIEAVGLSNAKGSDKKFIRIDGSTNPKARQAQIRAFQTDPSIRIAILGITAAGVAVTLTASSTVWFAELFWTPALMIQAEDRVHRIGQNAVVNCLYFVAEGTLDVLLWDLLEKKFRDLGEFVEGREKMKIVVHKTYDSIKDLQSIFSNPVDYDFEEQGSEKKSDDESSDDGEGLIKLEADLEEDITRLAQEEMVMISQAEGDDEDGNEPSGSNGEMMTGKPKAKDSHGGSAENAICLSDDDDEVTAVKSPPNEKPPASGAAQVAAAVVPPSNRSSPELGNARLYKQVFQGDSFDIRIYPFLGKLVIQRGPKNMEKPARGDVLVAINGSPVIHGTHMDHASATMRNHLARGAVELTFLEDKGIADGFARYIAAKVAEHQKKEAEREAAKKAIVENEDGVIELLDDD